MNQPDAPQRLTQLDGLRGLAALAVLAYHYTTRYGELFGHPVALPFSAVHGHYGVQLFFVISGFVIAMSLEASRSLKDFAISRLTRIYPAYWAAVLITFVVVTAYDLAGRQVGVAALLVNLTMLHQWLRVPHVDGVYWTLTLELVFYCWAALLYFGLRLRTLSRWIAGALVLWGLLLLVHTATGYTPSDRLANLLLLDSGAYFATGVLFYCHRTGTAAAPLAGLWLGLLALEWLAGGALEGLIFVLTTLLFVLASRLPFRTLLRSRWLVWLGAISYPLYLLHQNIGYVVIHAAYRHSAPAWLALGAAILASLALATLLHLAVEKPAMTRLKPWLRSLGARPGPSPGERRAERS